MKYIPKNNSNSVHYDAESDVLYFGVHKGVEKEIIEVAVGINAELDEQGKLIGIEILNASKVLQPVVKSLGLKILQAA